MSSDSLGGAPGVPPGEVARVGLCASCSFARVVENRRGSRFYRCGRSDFDPAFAKYPRLPVLACAGYEPGVPRVTP